MGLEVFIKVIVGLAGLIATGFFVVVGLGYITSSGNPERLGKSKPTLVLLDLSQRAAKLYPKNTSAEAAHNNQTFENGSNNRGEAKKKDLKNEIRLLWLSVWVGNSNPSEFGQKP